MVRDMSLWLLRKISIRALNDQLSFVKSDQQWWTITFKWHTAERKLLDCSSQKDNRIDPLFCCLLKLILKYVTLTDKWQTSVENEQCEDRFKRIQPNEASHWALTWKWRKGKMQERLRFYLLLWVVGWSLPSSVLGLFCSSSSSSSSEEEAVLVEEYNRLPTCPAKHISSGFTSPSSLSSSSSPC